MQGLKFGIDKSENSDSGSFQLYLNEVVLPDNTIIVKKGENITTYLSHDVMNYLITTNKGFSQSTHSTISNVLKRSSLISKVSERERNIFFEKMNKQIQALKFKIEN